MTFGAPGWFWGLLLLPLLTFVFIWAERRSASRLREFISPHLLPRLTGTVDKFRRWLRFSFVLVALAFATASLAQPRWGHTFEEVKRKGLDLLIAVDTSRSMLSNDVPPNRLQRVKLAVHDLISELQGDRIGLIAFAGRAFLQAPLTIDYDAVSETVNDLDTSTIPEGGSNISEAIALAGQTFGKSAIGNRALIVFTDGEELSGDAVKAAKAASEAGVRIFTIGVGTPEGSLIPVRGEDGSSAFVKDGKGQVVKSKLDEKRLRELAEATNGRFLLLDNSQRTMRELLTEGLGRMQAGEIDARLSPRPIERYQWPLSVSALALALSLLINERKRDRRTLAPATKPEVALASAALLLFSVQLANAAAPGLEAYREGKYEEAYRRFQEDLKTHPKSSARDKMQFDSGTAAFKMSDYNKALQAFSESLLSPNEEIQKNSHYNIGRTLEERADIAKADEEALRDLVNAHTHYEDVLKLDPAHAAAKASLEAVKEKIERLKKRPKQKPSPPPQAKADQKQDKSEKSEEEKQEQQQSGQGQDQNQQKQNKEDSTEQNQSSGNNPDQPNNQNQSDGKESTTEKQAGSTPSPSPGGSSKSDGATESQGPSGGETPESSPKPNGKDPTGSPSPGQGKATGDGDGASPTPAAAATPGKKLSGEVKGAAEDKKEGDEGQAIEPQQEGQMSASQAERLLESMRDEEQRVQLDERRAARRVYNDW